MICTVNSILSSPPLSTVSSPLQPCNIIPSLHVCMYIHIHTHIYVYIDKDLGLKLQSPVLHLLRAFCKQAMTAYQMAVGQSVLAVTSPPPPLPLPNNPSGLTVDSTCVTFVWQRGKNWHSEAQHC